MVVRDWRAVLQGSDQGLEIFFLILRVISAWGVSLCCTQTHFQKIDLLHFLVLEIFMLISHA